ncbi:MAG: iron-sulfur cluster assembly scaffold protein [Deltaproteobacteria bacterium]|nr:iron-sulfur cluster assembly scaffold protein [Deltaproteobacteria bacterium]
MGRKPDGYGKKTSDCGDTIELFLEIRKGVVKSAKYDVDGCNFTLACARAVTALALGCVLGEVKAATTSEKIDETLGGLPEHNRHCAMLASEAMYEAVTDAAITSREPWRKLYRK